LIPVFISQNPALDKLFDAAVAYINEDAKIKVGAIHKFNANFSEDEKVTRACKQL